MPFSLESQKPSDLLHATEGSNSLRFSPNDSISNACRFFMGNLNVLENPYHAAQSLGLVSDLGAAMKEKVRLIPRDGISRI